VGRAPADGSNTADRHRRGSPASFPITNSTGSSVQTSLEIEIAGAGLNNTTSQQVTVP
jgi:hypothetical protein